MTTTMPGELPHDESPDPFVQFGPGGMALLAVCKVAAVAGAAMLRAAGETSMILGLPLWIGEALMVPGFVLLALAGFYMAGQQLRAMRGAGSAA
jgi:TRAP-type mannitol/chloroaromatic compound transport system permease small subunit